MVNDYVAAVAAREKVTGRSGGEKVHRGGVTRPDDGKLCVAMNVVFCVMLGNGTGFSTVSKWASGSLGTPIAFGLACFVVIVWALTGPIFDFSDTWQLVINTGTTIVTFLMVFLLQNTQNRDARALHLKLDELLRSAKSARNRLIKLEDCTDVEMEELRQQFEQLRGRTSRPPP